MNSTTLNANASVRQAGGEAAGGADRINDVDVAAVKAHVEAIAHDPAKGMVQFRATTRWAGGFRNETRLGPLVLGGESYQRTFRIVQDEPTELLGTDTAPNPQEVLMAALNACIMAGFVANAAVQGIQLQSLEIESAGQLDLRGFLGLDPNVKPGYDSVSYRVRVRGNAPPEAFHELHETVKRLSPNYFNLSQPVRLDGELVVE